LLHSVINKSFLSTSCPGSSWTRAIKQVFVVAVVNLLIYWFNSRHTSSPGPPLVASSGKNTISTGRTHFPLP